MRATVDAAIARRLAESIMEEPPDGSPITRGTPAHLRPPMHTTMAALIAAMAVILGLHCASTKIRDSGPYPAHAALNGGLLPGSLREPVQIGMSSIEPPAPAHGLPSGAETMVKYLPATASAVLACNALATPPAGFVASADSVLDFSAVQGQAGWRYRFDRGEGTAAAEMAHYLPMTSDGPRWCPTPNFGGVSTSPDWSHCTLTADWSHANSAQECNTPAQGLLRPIREWSGTGTTRRMVHLTLHPATTSGGIRFDLLADGEVTWSRTWVFGNHPPADEWIEIPAARTIALRCDPVGSCGGDGAWQSLMIFSADCDGNGSSDDVEIAGGAPDANGNRIPDACECATIPGLPACCPADLNDDGEVNGADLGALIAFWGLNPSYPRADLTRDGQVNGSDLGLLLSAWGACGQ
jgi:hypothetical protein